MSGLRCVEKKPKIKQTRILKVGIMHWLKVFSRKKGWGGGRIKTEFHQVPETLHSQYNISYAITKSTRLIPSVEIKWGTSNRRNFRVLCSLRGISHWRTSQKGSYTDFQCLFKFRMEQGPNSASVTGTQWTLIPSLISRRNACFIKTYCNILAH